MRLISLFAMNGAKFLPIALAFAACILTPSEGFSQVDNIKRDVKKDKSSSSSRSSSSESSGDEGSSILGYIFVKVLCFCMPIKRIEGSEGRVEYADPTICKKLITAIKAAI